MRASRLVTLLLVALIGMRFPADAFARDSASASGLEKFGAAQGVQSLEATGLTLDRAVDLAADGSWVAGSFEKDGTLEGADRWRLYRIKNGRSGTFVARLIATADGSTYRLSLFGPTGRLVRTGYSAGVQQRLLWSSNGLESAMLVGVELVEEASDGGGEFQLALSALRPDQIVPEVGTGYALRERLAMDDYRGLVDFGRRDFLAKLPGDCAVKETYDLVQGLITGGRSAEPVGPGEPIIVFFGISGVNMVLLLRGGQGESTGCAVPLQTSLGRARHFWVVSLEDDAAPFDTFIDVEFQQRRQKADYEEFDPTSQARVRTLQAGSHAAKATESAISSQSGTIVRVGLKRFKVRQPPTVIEVAFSRQGAAYGLRQWQRSFSVLAWTTIRLGISFFVPFVPVTVDKHDAVPPTLATGEFPDFKVILKEEDNQYVFGGLLVDFPQVRARRQNALTRASRLAWGLVPDVTGGVALLNGRVWYLAGAWPLILDRVFLTAGMVIKYQEKLNQGYVEGYSLVDGHPVEGDEGAPIPIEVGARLPLDYPFDTLVHKEWIATPVIGIAVNFSVW